jgi:hypothetical protein
VDPLNFRDNSCNKSKLKEVIHSMAVSSSFLAMAKEITEHSCSGWLEIGSPS